MKLESTEDNVPWNVCYGLWILMHQSYDKVYDEFLFLIVSEKLKTYQQLIPLNKYDYR
jgi:hypothetical protein